MLGKTWGGVLGGRFERLVASAPTPRGRAGGAAGKGGASNP